MFVLCGGSDFRPRYQFRRHLCKLCEPHCTVMRTSCSFYWCNSCGGTNGAQAHHFQMVGITAEFKNEFLALRLFENPLSVVLIIMNIRNQGAFWLHGSLTSHNNVRMGILPVIKSPYTFCLCHYGCPGMSERCSKNENATKEKPKPNAANSVSQWKCSWLLGAVLSFRPRDREWRVRAETPALNFRDVERVFQKSQTRT